MALQHFSGTLVVFTGDPAAAVPYALRAGERITTHHIDLSNIGLPDPLTAIAAWWTLSSDLQNASAFQIIGVDIEDRHRPKLKLYLQANQPVSDRSLPICIHLLYDAAQAPLNIWGREVLRETKHL